MTGKHEAKERRRKVEDALAEEMRRVHSSGELAHMYGRPLDLSQDADEWLAARFLKQAGFSHPLIEQGREVDAAMAAVQRHLERLRDQRARLAAGWYSAQEADRFNRTRAETLERYRSDLLDVNRSIRDYNLAVPDALQRLPFDVEALTEQAVQGILPLPYTPPEQPRRQRQGLLRRLRLRGG
jgi:hypothetical protein